jgi:DNA-binding GntR family transcriptional regulator
MMSPEVRMQRGLERGTDDRSLQRVPPLVAQIADEVSNDIISGRFKPGERIREQDLADRFGTSRAPVREAIRLLEIEGLIETEHWRGARVVNLSVSQVEDLFEMISAIFGLVARLAARHGSRADFERFSAAVEEMQARHDEGSSGPERVRASFEAARVLREACASPLAGEMLVKLSRLAFIHHRLVQAADDPWQLEALAHWRELAGAVQARRDDEAELLARRIIKQTEIFTVAQLREAERSASAQTPKLKPRAKSARSAAAQAG